MVLPAEILDYILSLLESHELQSTTLALTRALPNSSISQALLWRNLRLMREGQSWECGKILRAREGLRGSIKTVVAEVWRDDPQLLINLLQSFPNLTRLDMTVGPLFSPEVIEELLTASKFKSTIQTLKMRFNPYVMERSYYTFLKGTYFDITPITIASWPSGIAPNLKALAFIQDLPPNHGSKTKVTPAFGLTNFSEFRDELQGIEEEETLVEEEISSTSSTSKKDLNFAQPIVFFKLVCLTDLAISPTGSQLTHLILRLPRRNLLPSLTVFPSISLPTPFPSLLHFDLSTTHILAHSPQLRLLLRLLPNLEYLILDRVTGLIGKGDQKEHSAYLTLIWLAKCCGGVGLSRSEDVMRGWRKTIKDRPTFSPAEGPPPEENTTLLVEKKERKASNRSGFANMPRAAKKATAVKLESVNLLFKSRLPMLVKDILIIPSRPKLKSLGLGLLSDLQSGTEKFWTTSFTEGYKDSIKKTVEKGEANLERWQLWQNNGSLEDGTRRLIAFRDAALEVGWIETEEPDVVFANFCTDRNVVSVSVGIANEIINAVRNQLNTFVFCCGHPDCNGEAGKPHLSLLTVSKESVSVREKREKKLWNEEAEERLKWRKDEKDHKIGCAHIIGRKVWDEQ